MHVFRHNVSPIYLEGIGATRALREHDQVVAMDGGLVRELGQQAVAGDILLAHAASELEGVGARLGDSAGEHGPGGGADVEDVYKRQM